MTREIKCKNCGNVVDINIVNIQKMLNDLLVTIQFGTDKRVVHLSLLTVLDDSVECCNLPDYFYTD